MQREFWVPVAAAGLSIAFIVVCLIVDLTDGHPRLVRAKLRLGGLLLTLTAMSAGAGCKSEQHEHEHDTFVSCYTGGCWDDSNQHIDALDYGCTTEPIDQWWFYAKMSGLAGTVALEIVETGDSTCWPSNPSACRQESHDLENTAYDDECGLWDEWQLTLDAVDLPRDVLAGSTTLFDCSLDDGNSLAFKVTMYDYSSPPMAHNCAIWGYKSHDYFNETMGAHCVCFDPDGDCSN